MIQEKQLVVIMSLERIVFMFVGCSVFNSWFKDYSPSRKHSKWLTICPGESCGLKKNKWGSGNCTEQTIKLLEQRTLDRWYRCVAQNHVWRKPAETPQTPTLFEFGVEIAEILLELCWNISATLLKPGSLMKHCSDIVTIIVTMSPESCRNFAETLQEHCSNAGRTLQKHWWNITGTLQESFGNVPESFLPLLSLSEIHKLKLFWFPSEAQTLELDELIRIVDLVYFWLPSPCYKPTSS